MKDSLIPANQDCVSHSLIEVPVPDRGYSEWHVNFHYADGSVRKFTGTRWTLVEKSRKVREWEETEALAKELHEFDTKAVSDYTALPNFL